MPLVHAYGFNLSPRDTKLIKAMLSSIAKPEQPIVTDLMAYDINKVAKNITEPIFIFGAKAQKLCNELKNSIKIDFPEPNLLYNIPGNEIYRDDAKAILAELEHTLLYGQSSEISQECKLPAELINTISIEQIAKVYNSMMTHSKKYWVCKLSDGKTLCLTTYPNDTIPADYHLTFQELYTLHLCKELLHTKEITIVPTTT